ncbi:Cys/Met metabolism PLP-dependent enzyme-domain-containing protein [Penicillium cf. viridicatum]|uniref:Cys/Met metabolism PLP-dependent enzyme-domain-containing protein n=1 Tax=Penicillium cf. viridicatum TaxID=2972119 RepID=A0A9W9MBB6_9EURO|nr:Cys/Met metabolism PLP-dependent enzyme-domain-containing protein [Penicillium cf. viridicatum]
MTVTTDNSTSDRSQNSSRAFETHGSTAVAMTMMALAGTGDNFVSSFHVHAGTFHQFGILAKQMGIEYRFVKFRDPGEFGAAIDNKTKFAWIEVDIF